MTIRLHLSSITLSGGEQIKFDSNNITLIVGPNNSGKSTLLSEIYQLLQHGINHNEKARKVIKQAEFSQEGEDEVFKEFLQKNTESTYSNGQKSLRAYQINVDENTAMQRWKNMTNGLNECIILFCNMVNTINRLTTANIQNSINVLSDTPQHPIHNLLLDDRLEAKLSKYVKSAFGEDIVLNRGAGNVLPLHFGKKPEINNGEDRVSQQYLKKLAELPQVQGQGDGIRSFIGCLLESIVLKKLAQ